MEMNMETKQTAPNEALNRELAMGKLIAQEWERKAKEPVRNGIWPEPPEPEE